MDSEKAMAAAPVIVSFNCLAKYVTSQVLQQTLEGSPGLVVMGGDSVLKVVS